MTELSWSNPFRPGAGHKPPYLAGREHEISEFNRLLKQDSILENLVLTGLRGVGKTVLLDDLKPLAMKAGWLWVGTDLSESASLSEQKIVIRLLTDLAVATSPIVVSTDIQKAFGFSTEEAKIDQHLDYDFLISIYEQTPGLISDKIKAVLEKVWVLIKPTGIRGIIFAYDEAQTMADHVDRDEFPLSLLLDVFQSIQKRDIPFMLALAGLPTLFPKLVEARTFAERMFHVLFLDSLDKAASHEAIVKPIQDGNCPVTPSEDYIEQIVKESAGYPYFIQFICREAFDSFFLGLEEERWQMASMEEIVRKLDNDFFAGRWSRATDRQRELLWVIANLPNSSDEFTVSEIAEKSKELLNKPFSSSHANQMLVALGKSGLVYKNRHGRYSFAIPLLGQYILRQRPL